jgi:hypothetical protein
MALRSLGEWRSVRGAELREVQVCEDSGDSGDGDVRPMIGTKFVS